MMVIVFSVVDVRHRHPHLKQRIVIWTAIMFVIIVFSYCFVCVIDYGIRSKLTLEILMQCNKLDIVSGT